MFEGKCPIFNGLFTVILKSRQQGNTGTAPSASSVGTGAFEKSTSGPGAGLGVRMKSGGPWNLKGLRPKAREAARTAARRSGMSVGEWLNDVIEPDEEEFDDEPVLFTDLYDENEDEDEAPARSRRRD